MSVHFTPTKKHCHFGIEVTKSMKWEQWEPGGEYTQQITLKNINRKTKKLKYRTPTTNFFTTVYPQPIFLGSGISISLPVTFRPLEKAKYEDAIEFITKEGRFKVSMKAVLPDAALNFPEMINFGMCAVKDQLLSSFKISNTSDLQVTFQLKSTLPFVLSPTSGTLAPKTNCDITIAFKPEGALVYETDVECIFGSDNSEKVSRVIRMEGIGKYLHLSVKHGSHWGHNIAINYGDVGVGKSGEKSFEIRNLSPVDAPFQIIQKSDLSLDKVFTCSQYHGTIPPESSIKVKLAFNPENINTTYVDNFEVLAVGLASKACIKCIGKSFGPNVLLDINSINFGIVKVKDVVIRSFKLRNNSCLDAVFQFRISPEYSVFRMNIVSGVIQANSTKSIIVEFVPTKPIVYFRKVFCLVQNQHPVKLELFGSCCTNEIKPVVLTRQHLKNNNFYTNSGISRLSPEEIIQQLEEEKIKLNESNFLEIVDKELGESLESSTVEISPFEEYMNNCVVSETSDTTPHIGLDVDIVDFGRSCEDTIIRKTVNVSNNTYGKVTCTWMNVQKSVFTVSPEQNDIEALSSSSFTIVFKPKETSKFYNAELEAFVFYKSMRDHRLVDETAVITPWCITINVMAHTFSTDKETFLPVCTWDHATMVFPPVASLTDSVYRTCLLINNGDNPINYSFQQDETKSFTCNPCAGLLRDKYQIVVFKMSPMEIGVNKRKIKCTVNDMEKFSQMFELVMTAESPEVTLSPKDFVYFKPTCIGNVSKQTVALKNVSRVPLRLRWKTLKVDEPFLKVEEEECTILSNEIQHHKWTFTPRSKTKYLFKVKLFVSMIQSNVVDDTKPQKYVLRLIGEGQIGEIKCDEQNIELKEVNVDDTVKRSVHISNNSGCSLRYHLCVDQIVTSVDDHDERFDVNEPVLILDHTEFMLPSKSYKIIQMTATPKTRANYKCDLYYRLILRNKEDAGSDDSFSPRHHLATITICGVYPQLQVNDVKGSGCVVHHSKLFLWKLFNLDNLNTLLLSDPSSAELKYHITSRHSTRRRMPTTTKATNVFNFGSAAYLSEACVVYLNIHNAGKSSTEWALRYPTDFQLDMEYWADTGELDEDEIHEMYVMNSELFIASPRHGCIQAGQSQTLTLAYNHTSLGVHRLPILLKIVQGREIKLEFVGITIESQTNRLHFTSYDHTFSPVSIGTTAPPVQSYTLHNGSSQTIRFAFDTSLLDVVQKDNYSHRIFECLTPDGELAPYQSKDTLWKFSPLEARAYSVGIPLMVENNETTIIAFHGGGYDLNLMGNTISPYNPPSATLFPTKQLVKVPNQLLKLSRDYVDFGHISLFCESNELLFLSNISEDRTISFRWTLKESPAENFVTITPSSGFLKSGENVMCKLKLYSTGPVAIHDFNIVCEVIDETLMAQFKCDLIEWRQRREEKKHFFTIRDVPERKLTTNRPGSTTSKRLISTSIKKPDIELKRYEALPPICKSATERHVIVEERPSTHDDMKPLPPRSIKSHLGVHVISRSLEEYKNLVPERILKTFVQRNPFVNLIIDKPFSLPASKQEAFTIENIFAKVLKDLIHDSTFRESIDALQGEATPYYAMLVPDLPLYQKRWNEVDTELGLLQAPKSTITSTNDLADIVKFPSDGKPVKRKTCIESSVQEICREQSIDEVINNSTSVIVSEKSYSSSTQKFYDDNVSRKISHRTNNNLILTHVSSDDVTSQSTTGDTSELRNENSKERCGQFSDDDLNLWDFLQERQDLKRNDEMRYLLYDILENTIFNILTEANTGEISLTNRPRLIALPPNSNGKHTP